MQQRTVNLITDNSEVILIGLLTDVWDAKNTILWKKYIRAIVFFSKSMKGKILNFLHEVEKMITVISVQV